MRLESSLLSEFVIFAYSLLNKNFLAYQVVC
jgi:hypothetical protein